MFIVRNQHTGIYRLLSHSQIFMGKYLDVNVAYLQEPLVPEPIEALSLLVGTASIEAVPKRTAVRPTNDESFWVLYENLHYGKF